MNKFRNDKFRASSFPPLLHCLFPLLIDSSAFAMDDASATRDDESATSSEEEEDGKVIEIPVHLKPRLDELREAVKDREGWKHSEMVCKLRQVPGASDTDHYGYMYTRKTGDDVIDYDDETRKVVRSLKEVLDEEGEMPKRATLILHIIMPDEGENGEVCDITDVWIYDAVK